MDRALQEALFAKTGAREISYRFDIMRGGVRVRSIRASGSVAMDSTAQIMGTARITAYEPVDMALDRIRPVVLIKTRVAAGVLHSRPGPTLTEWAGRRKNGTRHA